MAQDFSAGLYNSAAWKKARNAYAEKRHHLCEDCLAKGLWVTGEIVHHKIELTPENINDPAVTLNPDNFRLLCRECHALMHGAGKYKRWFVDENGKVIAR